jgi:predicted dehydrogenase
MGAADCGTAGEKPPAAGGGMGLRVAVIGTGKVATGQYLPYLSKREDVEPAYWNRTEEKARAAAAQFGGHVLSSLDELASWKPDVAMILTSERARYEVAMNVIAAAPPNLFFEKPLVAQAGQAHVDEGDLELGRELLAQARDAGCRTAMVFNYRFLEQTIRARNIVEERSFGPLVNASGLVHYACWSHCIDLVHVFAGDLATISALQGGREYTGAGMTAADVAVTFTSTAGAAGTLIGTAGTAWQYPLFELSLAFEGGRIHMRDLDGELEVLDTNRRQHEHIVEVRDSSRWQSYGASFEKAVGAYLDSVLRNDDPPVPGRAGLQELQTEAAIRRSIREGRPVRVQEEFPL